MKILRPKGLGLFLLTLFLSLPANALERRKCRDIVNRLLTRFMPITKGAPIRKLLFPWGSQTLASWSNTKVLGFVEDPGIYKEVIGTLRPRMRAFERYMTNLGFKRPKFTRIVVFDKRPTWPRRRGVYITPYGKAFSSMSKMPSGTMGIDLHPHNVLTVIRELSAFLHEYSHNFLFYTYRRDAFVNSGPSIQEALADFLSAHYRGSPVMGMGLGPGKGPLRDIEKKAFSSSGMGPDLTHPDMLGYRKYIDSIHYSNALWEMRKELGASALSSLIKDFIDNLNRYRHSFVELQKKAGGEMDRREKAVKELEYFLAVFKKSVVDSNDEKNVARVDQVIGKIAGELKLDNGRIDYVAQNIFLSEENFYSNKKSALPMRDLSEAQVKDVLYTVMSTLVIIDGLILIGTASAAGYGVYWVYERVSNSRE